MDLNEAHTWAAMMLEEHGLTQRGWKITWNNARQCAGICCYDTLTIGFSRPVTQRHPEHEFMDTVAHEIAHALVDSDHGHNAVWRAKAIELGGSGNQYSPTVLDPAASWIGICPHGTVFPRYRAPRPNSRAHCRCPGPGPIKWERNTSRVIRRLIDKAKDTKK